MRHCTILVLCVLLSMLSISAMADSRLSKPEAVCAIPTKAGIYLGWRLDSVNPSVGYNIYRKGPGDRSYSRINPYPVKISTNFLDQKVKKGKRYYYYVRAVDPCVDGEGPSSVIVNALGGLNSQNIYKKILYIAQNTNKADCKVGDIDGDGQPDFLIVCRDYQRPGKSPGPIHAKLYLNNSRLACDINMYETEYLLRTCWTLWDLNNDGRDEVIGVMKKTPGSKQYCLCVIDPKGKIIDKIDVPSTWPYTTRFKTITIAYLDGQKPHILYSSGHLQNQHRFVGAYILENSKLKMVWSHIERAGKGFANSHQFEVADIDNDGKDETFQGTYVFDEKGLSHIWGGFQFQHPDGVHIGDIRPDKPGQEVYFHLEGAPGGIYLTDFRGRQLWRAADCPKCRHAHAGWIKDVVSGTPGMEVWVYHKKVGEKMICPFLYSSTGKRFPKQYNFSYGAADWDGMGSLEVIFRNRLCFFNNAGTRLQPLRPLVIIPPGNKVILDVIGDYREEIISFSWYKRYLSMTIYTNTTISNKRKPSPCENRQYLIKHRWDGH